MKNAKRAPKKKDPSKTKAKPAASKELTEEQLENVAGGAVDAFLKWSGPGDETPELKYMVKL
jgi:hypothetical protein